MPPSTEAVFRLIFLSIIAFVVITLATMIFQASIFPLALHFGPNFHPAQILTHIFLYTGRDFGALLHLLFHCIILYGFGSELERTWGTDNFLRFFFVSILGGMVLTALVAIFLDGMVMIGMGAAISAMLVAYAMLWPDRQALFFFVIPIRMKYLVMIMFAMYAFLGGLNQLIPYSGGALAGALFLFYYARKGIGLSGAAYADSSDRGPTVKEKFAEMQKKRRLKKKQEVIEQRIMMKQEVDRILEKISKEGMDSLTRKEKQFLDQASKDF